MNVRKRFVEKRISGWGGEDKQEWKMRLISVCSYVCVCMCVCLCVNYQKLNDNGYVEKNATPRKTREAIFRRKGK